MFDIQATHIIELYHRAAETVLRNAGIRAFSKQDSSQFHGWVLFQYFDPVKQKLRIYKRNAGISPLRNYIRSGPADDETFKKIADIFEQVRSLQKHFVPLFGNIECDIVPADERYINDIYFGDSSSWIDDLYHAIEVDLSEIKTFYFGKHSGLNDLSEDFPKEFSELPEEIHMEACIKGAIDLVLHGPWGGFKVDCIQKALKKFNDEIKSGVKKPTSPIYHCLEPGQSWRWRHPLWHAGRFYGLFTVLMGGPLNDIKQEMTETFRELSDIGDELHYLVMDQRERLAEQNLNTKDLTTKTDLEEALRSYCDILLAPHRVTDLKVKDKNDYTHENNDESSNGSVPNGHFFKIEETFRDQRVSIMVELYDQSLAHSSELIKIYTIGELRRLNDKYAEAPLDLLTDDGQNQVSRRAIEKQAQDILSQNYEGKLSTKEYCLCFICLAILEKKDTPAIKIQGSMKDRLQNKLWDAHKISRKSQWDANDTLKRNKNGDLHTMPLSQLCDERAEKHVAQYLTGVFLSRDHDLVIIEFSENGPKPN